MLIEFFNIIVLMVPIVVIGAFFSQDIERSHRDRLIMQDAVHKSFFEDSCSEAAICENNVIRLQDRHKIYIRKSSSLFRTKEEEKIVLDDESGEVNHGVLEDLYDKLEEATKNNIE